MQNSVFDVNLRVFRVKSVTEIGEDFGNLPALFAQTARRREIRAHIGHRSCAFGTFARRGARVFGETFAAVETSPMREHNFLCLMRNLAQAAQKRGHRQALRENREGDDAERGENYFTPQRD